MVQREKTQEEMRTKKAGNASWKKINVILRRIIYFCFVDYTKASDCVDHNKLWKILNEMGKLDHITCLLRNGSDGEASVCNAGDLGSTPGLGRSPGEGNASPLQYSCLENPMDRRAW